MHKWMECTQTNFDSGAAPSGFHSGFRILAFDDDDDDDLPWPHLTNPSSLSDRLLPNSCII